jgi:hypothetical protein
VDVADVGEIPIQLRRNRQTVKQSARLFKELGTLLWRHGKSVLEAARIRNQISSDPEYQVSGRS